MTTPAGLRNHAISEYAEIIGAKYGIYVDGRADLDALLEALGGQREYAETSESLAVRDVGDFTVMLPRYTSVERDRFTVAHELGHYFMHYRLPKKTGSASFGRGERNRAETEANVFASALLMPEAEFKRIWKLLDGDTWNVARHFGVSPAAAGVRAEVLALS